MSIHENDANASQHGLPGAASKIVGAGSAARSFLEGFRALATAGGEKCASPLNGIDHAGVMVLEAKFGDSGPMVALPVTAPARAINAPLEISSPQARRRPPVSFAWTKEA